MYFIFALKQRKSPGLRKVFVSDMYIDNVKSTFLDHLSDIFKNIVCILNCHSLSHTCMSFPFSSFYIIFSLSLYLLSFSLYVTFLVFGILCLLLFLGFFLSLFALRSLLHSSTILFLFQCLKYSVVIRKSLGTQRYKDIKIIKSWCSNAFYKLHIHKLFDNFDHLFII